MKIPKSVIGKKAEGGNFVKFQIVLKITVPKMNLQVAWISMLKNEGKDPNRTGSLSYDFGIRQETGLEKSTMKSHYNSRVPFHKATTKNVSIRICWTLTALKHILKKELSVNLKSFAIDVCAIWLA